MHHSFLFFVPRSCFAFLKKKKKICCKKCISRKLTTHPSLHSTKLYDLKVLSISTEGKHLDKLWST